MEKKEGVPMQDVERDRGERTKALMDEQSATNRALANIAAAENIVKSNITNGQQAGVIEKIVTLLTAEGSPPTGKQSEALAKLGADNKMLPKVGVNLVVGAYSNTTGLLEIPRAQFADSIYTLYKACPDIAKFSVIGKGGKIFKTVRIPKSLINPPRASVPMSNTMILVQISNTLWRGLFARVRPPGIFTRAMMSWFKSLIPESRVNLTLSNNDVIEILKILQTNHPKLLAYFVAQRSGSSELRAAELALRQEGQKLTADVQVVMASGLANPERIQSVVGSLIGAYDNNASITNLTSANFNTAFSGLKAGNVRKKTSKAYRYLITAEAKQNVNYADTPMIKGMSKEEAQAAVKLHRMTKADRERFWPSSRADRNITSAQRKARYEEAVGYNPSAEADRPITKEDIDKAIAARSQVQYASSRAGTGIGA